MNFRRSFRVAVSVGIAVGLIAAGVQAQLHIGIAVDVTRNEEGVFEYRYVLENSSLSSQTVNSILLTTGAQAPILEIAGPSADWVAAYAMQEEVFQAGFATGLSAAGDACGATSGSDILPGQQVAFSITSLWGPAPQSYAIGRTEGIGVGCDFVGDIATGLIASPSQPIRPCDIDGDGDCDVVDIDALAIAISTGAAAQVFDLNRDNVVNLEDLDWFLQDVGRANGDADLNGSVEFADFLALSGNFARNATWSRGDFDADGRVGFPDFLILSGSFGAMARTATVPEPELGRTLVALLVTGPLAGRRHRNGPRSGTGKRASIMEIMHS